MALDTENFFGSLPADEFEPFETQAREALLSLASRASEVGLPGGRFPLQAWIDRRLGAELRTSRDSRGNCEVALPKTDAGVAIGQYDETFFSSLPVNSFSPQEEVCRDAIFDFLAGWRRQDLATMTHLRSDPRVKAYAQAFLPPSVSLDQWMERRVGGEVEIQKDSLGNDIINVTPEAKPIVMARFQKQQKGAVVSPAPPQPPPLPPPQPPPPVAGVMQGKGMPGKGMPCGKGKPFVVPQVISKEEWLNRLPDDQLGKPEINLRQAILDFLEGWPKKGPPPSTDDAMKDSKVAKCCAVFIPSTVTLKDWIESRVGGEIELKGNLFGGLGDATAQEGDFLDSLPEDSLTDEEVRLRQAVLDVLQRHPQASLRQLGQNPAVATAQRKLLPGEFTLRDWLDRRVGGEVEVDGEYVRLRDASNQGQMAQGSGAAATKKGKAAGKGASKNGGEASSKLKADDFFASLPESSFTDGEENLRDAILSFMENWAEEDMPSLSKATIDETVRRCKAEVLPKGNSVSLKEWIERRLGGELEIVRDEKGTLVLGVRMETDETTEGTGMKRDAEEDEGDWSSSKSRKQ